MECKGKSDACKVKRSEFSDKELDIEGQPYRLSVLKVGYCIPQPDGSFRADGTISLLTGPKTILVDTGGPWDRDFLVKSLRDKGLEPGDVSVVVGTHGHSDHVGNLGLFPGATVVVGCDISVGDRYLPNRLAEGRPYPIDEHVSVVPTPGHTGRDVSVLVKGTTMGTVLVAGDLFERCADDDSWRDLSENPVVQEASRQLALRTSDVIIPGHGLPFRVHREEVHWRSEPTDTVDI
ncbi:metallo-beta-lactamase domain-containing protein 1 [Esox lucius]|uniref:Metallo-beta-lactamase domain-containing protein 1 n=1 Tax=Esox lucius TaxID=8010 RepID=A0AAY5K7R2_ESOLU|nr:metallo-beta-lactamase domain-containing protein 1 [Esox lucius]